ncbi:hypothetical protein BJ928_14412, partial [Rhizobium sp. WW_1]
IHDLVSTYFGWKLHASEHRPSEGAQKFALTIVMRHQRPSAILPKHAGSRDRRAEPAGCASIHSWSGRTSMLGPQEVDQKKNQKGCSGKYASLWTAPHGCERAARTRDATDTKAREPRSRGCCVVVLYNDHRPHSGLGWMTPAEFAQTINPRRDAVLRSRNGSTRQAVATGPNTSTQNRWSELRTG